MKLLPTPQPRSDLLSLKGHSIIGIETRIAQTDDGDMAMFGLVLRKPGAAREEDLVAWVGRDSAMSAPGYLNVVRRGQP